jgi:hypothetical protein
MFCGFLNEDGSAMFFYTHNNVPVP